MGKTVIAVVGVVASVAIAVAAPFLAPLALGVLGIAATTTAVAIATALIGVGLGLAATFAFRALGVGAPSAKNAVGPPQVFRQSIANSFIVYGRRRVGGLMVFFHGKQVGSDHFRYFVIACAGHRCVGVVDWMLGDEIVTVDGSGAVTSGKYAGAAWLWFQRGLAAETANATFVAECDGQWTTSHKGNGVAAIHAKFQMTDAVVQAGMPNITAVIDGRDEIRDPRDGSTGFTANAVLVFYDWLNTPREEGGFGAYADEIADAWVSAQANVCDEVVDSEARYELHGVIQTGAAPNEIRDAMIVNCAGTYSYSGGKHLMRPGYWVPVSATLGEDDLAAPIQVSPFATADAAANEVQGTFISPAANYQGAPFTTQMLDPPPADVRQVDLDLAFTTSLHQADRVASIMLRRSAAEKSVVWPMNIAGIKVRALDTVQLDTARYGLSNYAWSIANWALSADWGVVLNLREENEEIYDEPPVASPVSPPPVAGGDPVLTQAEVMQLIRDSTISGLTFSIADTGAVTISTHTRTYSDKSVSVTGTGGSPHATGASAGDAVYIFYDDPGRAGGAVTYQHLVLAAGAGDDSPAYVSPTHPYRHRVAAGPVPATGGTTGGGSDPGTVRAPGTTCPTVDTPILISASGVEKPAGEMLENEFIFTRHETTLEWGLFRVETIVIARDQEVSVIELDGQRLRATPEHRVRVDGEWKTIAELGAAPDGVADVVQMTIAEAHTMVTNGILSHNIKSQSSSF